MSAVPLAERLRPTNLDQVIGQTHLLGAGKPLRVAFESGQPHSMILWGPPGVGKTTLARLMAEGFQSEFIALSAVLSGVKDIREAVERAQIFQANSGRKTILFVDEVHRFNKSQQDAFLPHVESGLFTFIALSLQEKTITITDDARDSLIASADGDGRKLLNNVEIVLRSAELKQQSIIDAELLKDSLGDALRRFDKGGDSFYDQISALHKSVRGSHPDAALYWLVRMLDGGADPRYLSRRLIRMASEDIGLADPRALRLTLDAAETYERLGTPEGELALAEAVVYLACAAKSNAVYNAYNAARAFISKDKSRPVPEHLRNAPTKLMKELGYGKLYRYAHDEPDAYAAGETYLPEGMSEPDWYQPTPRGLESKIAEKLAFLRAQDKEARKKSNK